MARALVNKQTLKKGGSIKKYAAGGSMDTVQVKKYMNTPSTGNKIKPLANPGVDPSKKNAIPKKPASEIVKKYQLGSIVKTVAKGVAKGVAKKITKFSSEAERIAAGQKTNLEKANEASLWSAKQGTDWHKRGLKQAIERRTNPAAATKKMTKAQRESFALDESYRKKGGTTKK